MGSSYVWNVWKLKEEKARWKFRKFIVLYLLFYLSFVKIVVIKVYEYVFKILFIIICIS